MGTLDDLVGRRTLQTPAETPDLMVAEVIGINPITVTVKALDGGARAHRAFGTWPDAVAGDAMRVKYDDRGDLVAVAWEGS